MPSDMPEKLYMTEEQFAAYERELRRYHRTMEAEARRQSEAAIGAQEAATVMAKKGVDADLSEKRDWFAGQALPGIIAQPGLEGWEPRILAKWSYQMADAMLAARQETPDAE